MRRELNCRKSNQRINDCETWLVECPTCKCKNAALITTKNRETYALVCPNQSCTRREILLHALIRDYGRQYFDEWRKARWTNPYDWKPIKNRKKKT